ncbi:MAG TPA: hypothetical protein VFH88_12840 [Candidatus Krumholzibacteria bacterium]|nr:hypothetical protein [Candidatus Krumholzibacteria bacterium]
MRFSVSNSRIWITLVCVVAFVSAADTAPRAGKATADSSEIHAPAPPSAPAPPNTVRKKIVIGGSGVQIREEGGRAGADSDMVHYNYKFSVGTDKSGEGDAIVKVAESVFIPADREVTGDVVVFGGNAIIEGKVDGSVVVMGGEIRARRGAEIKGDVVAIGGAIEEDEEVVIRGERVQVGGVANEIGDRLHVGTRTIRTVASLGLLFIALVLFFITLLFLRGKIETVSSHITAGMFKCFGAGVLTSAVGVFALLIVMIPLIITIVGIPLAVVLCVSCIGVYVIACTAFVFTVGRSIAGRMGIEGGAFAHLFIGIIALSIPEIIAFVIDSIGHAPMAPYILFWVVGTFVWLFAYVVGLGAIVLSRFGSRPVEPAPPSRPVGEPAPVSAS